VPLVELGAAPMSTSHGRKSKPVLKVVGWRNTAGRVLIGQPDRQLPSPAAEPVHDMDDDIPF
jgi:hypothetical protein